MTIVHSFNVCSADYQAFPVLNEVDSVDCREAGLELNNTTFLKPFLMVKYETLDILITE